MSNSVNENKTAIISAFEISENPFPSEVEFDSTLWNIFYEGYDGYANALHFGWLDMVQLNALVKSCGITHLIVQGLDTIGRAGIINGHVQLCNGYVYQKKVIHAVPKNDFQQCKPLYDSFSFHVVGGWDFMPDEIDDLPIKAKWYMRYILINTGVKEVIYLDDNISVTAYFVRRKQVDFITKKT